MGWGVWRLFWGVVGPAGGFYGLREDIELALLHLLGGGDGVIM